MTNSKTVIVGLSGGVDSAVAACMLINEGYRVIGLNIRVLDTPEESPELKESAMCVSENPAYHFPVFALNLSVKFRNEIINYFNSDYLAGRTPNPCTVCNKQVKWYGLLEGARMLEADLVATGHYARSITGGERYGLFKGLDPQKDQSYFLWMLTPNELSRTLFPLGALTKESVRKMAREFGVTAAEKKDSQEICFVPHHDYRDYLKSAMPGLEEKVEGGEIVDREGKVVGKHHGYPFYTVGQRKGLGLFWAEPRYVTALDAERNRITVGKKSDLSATGLTAEGLNWISFDDLKEPIQASAKIRYRDTETPCRIEPAEKETVRVTFESPKNAVTPGQAVVFYRDDEVLGGGFITSTF